jgi:flagellar motor switch protein FliN
MSEKLNFLDCWSRIAAALFAQALSGEPELAESLPRPLPPGSSGFVATIAGDQSGRFAVVLDAGLFEAPLHGEGVDQKAAWAELLKEVADATVGEMLAKAGIKLHIEKFEPTTGESKVSRAFQLKSVDRAWTILVRDEVRVHKAATEPQKADTVTEQQGLKPGSVAASAQASSQAAQPSAARANQSSASSKYDGAAAGPPRTASGIDLLLDVELEASLRFGAREMPLGEILDLGPGDVVQLDRHIADPVDLLIGDKIVARGEVVLVNGNFGLRVTEVAEPQRRLESIRCLF